MSYPGYFALKLNRAYTILHRYGFKADGRMSTEKFRRERQMGFAEMGLLILSGSKRSLQTASYTFLPESRSELDPYSKQAFSRRRQFIKPEAFLTRFRSIAEDFYTDPAITAKSFLGLNVFAVDGTTYNLPDTTERKEIYGVQTAQGTPAGLLCHHVPDESCVLCRNGLRRGIGAN